GEVRALQLRRIDHLNIGHALLGFTRPQLREALVLLDEVDELLVSYVLPALADGASVSLLDAETAATKPEWQAAAAQRPRGAVARGEYGGALSTESARRIGGQLTARRTLFEHWQHMLEPQGISVVTPSTLDDSGTNYQEDLAGMVPSEDLAQLASIDDSLSTP